MQALVVRRGGSRGAAPGLTVPAASPISRVSSTCWILGTSLSAIDAAMAVVTHHGDFVEEGGETVGFVLDPGCEALSITLMSRSCILPETDFYCPIPYEPLTIATPQALEDLAQEGGASLLDKAYDLLAREIAAADPAWTQRIDLFALDVETFTDAYFADRQRHDPFRWAQYNLAESEANKRNRVTVAWRYAIHRLHEAFQEIVPNFEPDDRERFDKTLSRVFTDNYAAIPAESIRRLLALKLAGILDTLELGNNYDKQVLDDLTILTIDGARHEFDVFIDARGQRAMMSSDLPFPRLRQKLLAVGQDVPDVCDDYSLNEPQAARGRIALGALPYLMHDQPFVQGITASAEIGSKIAAITRTAPSRVRRKLALSH